MSLEQKPSTSTMRRERRARHNTNTGYKAGLETAAAWHEAQAEKVRPSGSVAIANHHLWCAACLRALACHEKNRQ